MAEILVKNNEHWMDSLTPEQIAEQTATCPNFPKKYAKRYQLGDIVEAQEDGFWTGGARLGWGYPKLALLIVPGLTRATIKQFMAPRMQNVPLVHEFTKTDWNTMKSTGEYYPFVSKPTSKNLTSETVELTGMTEEKILKRNYRLNMASITLDAEGKATISGAGEIVIK